MKIRIKIDASFDPTDTAHIDQLKNGVLALKDYMQRVNQFETSTITVEKCRHDEGGSCETIYTWSKT